MHFLLSILFVFDYCNGESREISKATDKKICREIVDHPGKEKMLVHSEFWKNWAKDWNWSTVARIMLDDNSNVSVWKVWYEISNLGMTHCCELPSRLSEIYGQKRIRIDSLCTYFFSKPANPIAYVYHASRPFGGGARALNEQWARTAHFHRLNYTGAWVGKTMDKSISKCDANCVKLYNAHSGYPYTIPGLPFIAGFDAIITEIPRTQFYGKINPNPIKFMAQTDEPRLIYVSNTQAAWRKCYYAIIQPAEKILLRKGGSIVIYASAQAIHTQDADVRGSQELRKVLNSFVVSRVYAVNAVFTHPKLKGSPMGFHSGHAVMRAIQIASIAKQSKPWRDKLPIVQACFSSSYPDRLAAKKFIQQECNGICKWCDDPLPKNFTTQNSAQFFPSANPHINQLRYWREVSRYQFALSPYGNGKECGRSFELLALSTVPIMHAYPGLNQMAYEGLPVIIVNSWSEITPSNLRTWSKRLSKFFDTHNGYTPLTRVSPAYQLARMRADTYVNSVSSSGGGASAAAANSSSRRRSIFFNEYPINFTYEKS
uniref:Exostosin GT47 domain-containing protein n=1 Tax=Aureoumbra lagunensis TaxID=44058 RepID=A0A7S3K1H8_9STRA|mmetsp:Transcript_14153/g.21406  ORF Transcript_14153/g.21406 Transcript_14153/m.21406 type:complete len:543 (+) Transcript_14153:101-1729(+)